MFILELCRKLTQRKISYCIVGGTAVALHGAIRGTVDVDLVVALDEKSFMDVESVLREMGLESRLPVRAKEVFQFREEYISKRNLIAWGFINPSNPVQQVDVIITEDVGSLSPITLKLHGTKVRVASVEGLIWMKKKSGRPQDMEDIQALQELRKR